MKKNLAIISSEKKRKYVNRLYIFMFIGVVLNKYLNDDDDDKKISLV